MTPEEWKIRKKQNNQGLPHGTIFKLAERKWSPGTLGKLQRQMKRLERKFEKLIARHFIDEDGKKHFLSCPIREARMLKTGASYERKMQKL